MAFISKEELAPFINTSLIRGRDFAALAEISRKEKLKREETGYSAKQMENFTYGNTCSERTKKIILDYFRKKLAELKKEVLKY